VATLVYILHKPIDLALAVVFLPFRALPPVVALVVVSALSGLLMLWVFAKFGDQDRIRRTKERIRGQLLGVRLYQHDVRIVLGLQASILRGILSYFRTSLVPMLILLLPLALILIQLNRHFAYRPLEVGQSTVVTVHTDGGSEGDQPEILPRPSDGVTVETRALREPGRGRISWRVRVDGPALRRSVSLPETGSTPKNLSPALTGRRPRRCEHGAGSTSFSIPARRRSREPGRSRRSRWSIRTSRSRSWDGTPTGSSTFSWSPWPPYCC
jgi:hypothetical protein